MGNLSLKEIKEHFQQGKQENIPSYMQVQPVDNTVIAHVKTQSESMSNLEGSSHLVSIQAQCKLQTDVIVCIPSPGGSKHRETSMKRTGQKRVTTPKISSKASGRPKEGNKNSISVREI